MAKFKVGDKVRMKAGKWHDSYGLYLKNFGRVLTVAEGSDDDFIYFTNDDGRKEGGWLHSRFEAHKAPEYRIGDLVMVTEAGEGNTQPGMVGTVIGYHMSEPSRPLVKFEGWDGGHWGHGASDKPDCWYFTEDFDGKVELAKPSAWFAAEKAPEARYIVVVEEDGKLAPALKPKEFKSQAQAEKVAQDMTKKHGGKFYVFASTAVVEAPKADYSVKRISA